MIQKFLVQFEDSKDTRWIADPARIVEELGFAGRCIAAKLTDGKIPAVSIIREEAPEKAGGQ